MQFKQDAKVYTSNHEEVGRIDRVVMDIRTREITHVVVRKGSLFTEDKVVPIDLIASTNDDEVTLRQDAGDLQELPNFEETHYLPMEQEQPGKGPIGYAAPVFWYPPVGAAATFPSFLIPPQLTQVEQHIPEGTVALRQGAKVTSADGKHAGDVEEIITSPEADRVTHLVLAEGVIRKERKLVPTTWVDNVTEDDIRLTVDSAVIDKLPAYEG